MLFVTCTSSNKRRERRIRCKERAKKDEPIVKGHVSCHQEFSKCSIFSYLLGKYPSLLSDERLKRGKASL